MPPVSAATTAKQRWQTAAHSARFIKRSSVAASSLGLRANRLQSMSNHPSMSRTVDGYSNVVTYYQVWCYLLELVDGLLAGDGCRV
jgi:hypothetical protein